MDLVTFLDQARSLSESGNTSGWLSLAHEYLQANSGLELFHLFDALGSDTQSSAVQGESVQRAKAHSSARPALLHHVGLTFFVPSINKALGALHAKAQTLFPENTRVFPSVLLKRTLRQAGTAPKISIFKSQASGSLLSCEVLFIQTDQLDENQLRALEEAAGPLTHLAFDVHDSLGELHRGNTLSSQLEFERRTASPVENPMEGLTSSYFDGTLAQRPLRLELCYARPELSKSSSEK